MSLGVGDSIHWVKANEFPLNGLKRTKVTLLRVLKGWKNPRHDPTDTAIAITEVDEMEIAADAGMAIEVGLEDVVTAIPEVVDARGGAILAQGATVTAEVEHHAHVVKGEVSLAEAEGANAAVGGEHPAPVVMGEVSLVEAEVVIAAAEGGHPAPIEIQAALVVPEDSRRRQSKHLLLENPCFNALRPPQKFHFHQISCFIFG